MCEDWFNTFQAFYVYVKKTHFTIIRKSKRSIRIILNNERLAFTRTGLSFWNLRSSLRAANDGWMDEWMNEWMNDWMDGWVDGWMDGWMDGEREGWVDGWMDGWVGGWASYISLLSYFFTEGGLLAEAPLLFWAATYLGYSYIGSELPLL